MKLYFSWKRTICEQGHLNCALNRIRAGVRLRTIVIIQRAFIAVFNLFSVAFNRHSCLYGLSLHEEAETNLKSNLLQNALVFIAVWLFQHTPYVPVCLSQILIDFLRCSPNIYPNGLCLNAGYFEISQDRVHIRLHFPTD